MSSVGKSDFGAVTDGRSRGSSRRLVIVGPPGAGKSSQGVGVAARLGVAHLSTGEILRAEVRRGSPLGRQAREYIEGGGLVPDQLVLDLVEQNLSGNAHADGFVLDGFPRTLAQAQLFTRALGRPLDRVIELATPDDVVIGRLANRVECSQCGGTVRDVDTERCARCSGPMQRREDDDRQVIRSRLAAYRREAKPMLDFFRDAGLLCCVDGDRSRYDVSADVWLLATG